VLFSRAATNSAPRGAFDIGHLYVPEVAEVWPENWPAVLLFVEMAGQWRAGMSGPTALDYTALFLRMQRMNLSDANWQQIFDDVRVMESAALEQMHE
jgi:hypothetical protein